jgi:hypothetical protein
MISFKDYLKKNKGDQQPARIATFVGYNTGGGAGIDYTDNSQAIGDVSGEGQGTIGGEEEEMSILQMLQTRNAAEEEEVDLEFADEPASENDPNEDAADLEMDGEGGDDIVGKMELPDEGDATEGDPDKQGLIRRVPGAHLVYKRVGEEGTFEELWMYEIKKGLRDEYDIRDDIIAGTDIVKTQTQSQDGAQSYSMWTAGNMQLLKIIGLPN